MLFAVYIARICYGDTYPTYPFVLSYNRTVYLKFSVPFVAVPQYFVNASEIPLIPLFVPCNSSRCSRIRRECCQTCTHERFSLQEKQLNTHQLYILYLFVNTAESV